MDKKRIDENRAVELALKIYAHPNGCAGGPLHIVLDDGNFEDQHIQWCIDHIEDYDCDLSEELKNLCIECAELLLSMKMRGRYNVWHKLWVMMT